LVDLMEEAREAGFSLEFDADPVNPSPTADRVQPAGD
jgi:hypothetical protein